MTEFVPASRPKIKLSFEDRLYIIRTVNALMPQQFDELLFALDPPKGIVPPDTAPQGNRSKALLDWVESPTGPGLLAVDKGLQEIIPAATKTANQFTAFAISGRLGDLSPAELEAIVQLLRKKTGDNSIDIAFFGKGSIKLVLSGSTEGLEKLQELFESGELANVLENIPTEYVQPIDNDTTAARKALLIQALRLRDSDLTLTRDRASSLVSALVSARDSARTIASVNASYLYFAIASGLTSYLDRAIDLANYLVSAIDPVSASYRAIASDLASYRAIASDLDRDRAIDLDHDRAIASDLAIDLDRAINRAIDLAHGLDQSILDLSGVDLSGANLRSIDLRGALLTGTNLTHAIVERTLFGDNPGLTEADKDDLRRRGAIFQDSPGSNTPALVRR